MEQTKEHKERNKGRSEERRVGKSVDLGGRRIIKKTKSKRVEEDSTSISNDNNMNQGKTDENKTEWKWM